MVKRVEAEWLKVEAERLRVETEWLRVRTVKWLVPFFTSIYVKEKK